MTARDLKPTKPKPKPKQQPTGSLLAFIVGLVFVATAQPADGALQEQAQQLLNWLVSAGWAIIEGSNNAQGLGQ